MFLRALFETTPDTLSRLGQAAVGNSASNPTSQMRPISCDGRGPSIIPQWTNQTSPQLPTGSSLHNLSYTHMHSEARPGMKGRRMCHPLPTGNGPIILDPRDGEPPHFGKRKRAAFERLFRFRLVRIQIDIGFDESSPSLTRASAANGLVSSLANSVQIAFA